MKVLCIIYSNDPETVWNAYRFANSSLVYDNQVNIFLLGKGVEAASISTLQFDVQEQMDLFSESGGVVIGCGVCCENREDTMPFLKEQLKCEMGSMQQLYTLVAEADKVLTF
jgi:sulfur relay (sulfurtransferase) complex TusBCD TusD component (DsrE family)